MPSRPTLSCAGCAKPMWVGKGTLPQGEARCRDCRRAAPAPTCKGCGAEISKGQHEHCKRCAGGRTPRAGRICGVCGETYTATSGGQKTCSRTCADTLRPEPEPRPHSSRVYFCTCAVCADLFCARAPHARLCSPQCRIDHAGLRVKDLYGMVLDRQIPRGEQMHWYEALISWLRARDGDACALCGEGIDFAVRSGVLGSDRGRSVDHVMPRSKGGADDPENLQLAHWGCNRGKRAKVDRAA